MTKLSLKEVAEILEDSGGFISSEDLKGEDIQDGEFAKLWDEYVQVSLDSKKLGFRVHEYLEPYLNHVPVPSQK